MKGGGVSRGSRVPHTYSEKNDFSEIKLTKCVYCKVYIGTSTTQIQKRHKYKYTRDTDRTQIWNPVWVSAYLHYISLLLGCWNMYDPHTEENLNNNIQFGLQTKYGCTSNPLVTAASLPLSSSSTWHIILSMYKRICVFLLDMRLE